MDEIAIVGVGCRFPGANNLKEYWRVLSHGENHVKEIPRERWNADAFYDPDPNVPGKAYVRNAAFVSGIDKWDHRFYNISDVEAELVDPQQRIVLDCVHMALEDGGIIRKDISGTQTGVYIGSMTDDYKGFVMDDNSMSSTYSVTGTHNSIISARVSFTYNLLGPSMTLDTACSSSLVAIDVASQALATGNCTMCICGGVNILMDPQLFVALSKAGMLSPTGQCKTFAKDADGYARGEGCGIVILKTLKDAINDGNKIWGTIKTGTNQNGCMTSLITAPSGLQQEKLIERIFERFGVDKSRIQVIEAHGTGTAIGDPTEVEALGKQFGKSANAKHEVSIGSVKTNIGHLEAAAGVAGLIKVLLMMKHNMIVPSLWYTKDNENPLIKLSLQGFIVPTECTYWERSSNGNRIASVNSFGFGGTNAHCIVEEYITSEAKTEHDIVSSLPYILAITAYSKDSLIANVRHVHNELKLDVYDMSVVSYTSTCKRDHRPHRKVILGNSQDDVMTAIEIFLSTSENLISPIDSKKVVFVFCGVGTAWKGMCTLLMNYSEEFKREILRIDEHLKALSGWIISKKIIDNDIFIDPIVTHIAIFACQIGLAALWKSLGIEPDVVVGQSVGEVAAAYVAGYLDIKTAVKIIFHRSTLLGNVTLGRMAVVRNVEVDVVKKYCETTESLTISVFNSPESCTVSGSAKDIGNLKHYLSTMLRIRSEVSDLDVQCAYHSHFVDHAAKELQAYLQNIQYSQAHIPMVSTVTGKLMTNDLSKTSNYWEKNVKMPVLFSDAIKFAEATTGRTIFLELGPSPVLRAHIDKIFGGSNTCIAIPSIQKRDEINTFTKALCSMFELGVNPKWEKIVPQREHLINIPTYKFRKYGKLYRDRSAVMKKEGIYTSNAAHLYVNILPKREDDQNFEAVISEEGTPFIFQHLVAGVSVLPGAAYADVGFEIGSTVLGLSKHKVLLSLEFLRPLILDTGIETILDISTVTQREELLFHSKHNHITMCKGWIRQMDGPTESQACFDIEGIEHSISHYECKQMYEKEMYANLESFGFKYGPCFTVMKSCITNGVESLTKMELLDDVVDQYKNTTLHPCVLDGMMQSTINSTVKKVLDEIKDEKLSFMPVAIGEIRVTRKLEQRMYIFTRRINTTILDTVLQMHYNILLLSESGVVIADVRNYTTYCKRNASIAPCELKYRLTWQPFENENKHNTKAGKVIVLTNKLSKDACIQLEEFDELYLYQNEDNSCYEEFITRSFQEEHIAKKLQAVVLLISKYSIGGTDISAQAASEIHTCIRNNCMLLTTLVRYMTNKNISVPLYVTTQNTQPSFSKETVTLNLVGEELWGFTRSIHLEFIHGDITLVDLQPSLQETKHALVSFIRETCLNIRRTNPEIIIHYDEIYGAQLTKVPRKELIPKLRCEYRVSRKCHSSYNVLADRSKDTQSLILTQSSENKENTRQEFMTVQVKNVCLHPLLIYPRTTSGIHLDQDIWKDNLDDGYKLFGLEYTCIPLSDITNWEIYYKKSEKKDMEHEVYFKKQEILAVFPSYISTKMSVPKGCTMLLKDIPFYQPGLILTTVLSWSLVKHVPKNSNVFVYSSQGTSRSRQILENLVCEKRNASLVDWSNYQDNHDINIDVLVSIEKLDITSPLLRRCKMIICLHECITESMRLKASRSGEQTIVTFSATELLDWKTVSECLRHVALWLETHFKSLGDLNPLVKQDRGYELPFPSIEIMKEKEAVLPIRNPLYNLFSKSDIYIVTGGLTGLGWEFILILAEMGAGIIGSISRHDRKTDKADNIAKIEKATGCKIITAIGDVSDLNSISCAIKEIESCSKTGSIRGIFHGAGVLEGKLLMTLKESQLEFVLRPKVIGTLNMHIATKDMDLDFFVVTSSINSVIGSPGQSSYGAANSFLDTFVEWRRRQGLPGQAIDWGALSVGMASRPEFVENFTKRGFNLLSTLEIKSCLQDALLRNASNIIYTNIDWDIHAKDYISQKMERLRLIMSVLLNEAVSYVMHDENDKEDGLIFDVKSLSTAGEERQFEAITLMIQKISSKVIKGEKSEISMTATLAEMSFDSMSTVIFSSLVHNETGCRIPSAFMLDTNNTLSDIVQYIFHNIFAENNKIKQ